MTAGSSMPFHVRDGQYGVATPLVQEFLYKAESHHWFPRPDHVRSVKDVESLLDVHIAALVESGCWSQPYLRYEFLRGGSDVAADAYREGNPSRLAKDPAYARGDWRIALGGLVEQARRHADECGTRKYFVPPLFPFANNPVVVGQMLTARYDHLDAFVEDVQDRNAVWYAMSAVDGDFWDAILWEIAYQGGRRFNPFALLLDIYSLGYYPLGSLGESLLVYSRA